MNDPSVPGRVAAVVVTWNRAALLERILRHTMKLLDCDSG